jgi:hypothetical protein
VTLVCRVDPKYVEVGLLVERYPTRALWNRHKIMMPSQSSERRC